MTDRKPPWKKANPNAKAGKSQNLTLEKMAKAQAAAKKAGRPYPNLVDNMRAASTRSK